MLAVGLRALGTVSVVVMAVCGFIADTIGEKSAEAEPWITACYWSLGIGVGLLVLSMLFAGPSHH